MDDNPYKPPVTLAKKKKDPSENEIATAVASMLLVTFLVILFYLGGIPGILIFLFILALSSL
jgi:hypothetical protein